ncbi:hypothetical protein FQ775_01040 [Nitratireductor mangrovi]|uniref:Helix-hairpin-helix DNA-binding motif class 1 domain-containing protein n=1 Tax=Nitratireductor mangrovi TaxID=2599600 RepID=A0A5B8KU39_9HYPH|nr:helix-hairpin-helix domain-containing protein [Nitratireductor mangrovi]QDY99067.1 hypothetical protein FQ775_01040 [Nitratireductor mangrovi]
MDDLTRIKGIGKATAKRLAEAGIDSFAKLAAVPDDALAADELGIEGAWIAQATELATENTQEKPPRSEDEPEAQLQDGAGLPADSGAGDPHTNSPDTPEGSSGTAREAPGTLEGREAKASDVGVQPGSPHRESGSGDPAVPETQPTEETAPFLQPGFVESYPHFAAALDAWVAKVGREQPPSGVRIVSKREGFRRAGFAHSKQATEHPIGQFHDLDRLEALCAEPMLTVELV